MSRLARVALVVILAGLAPHRAVAQEGSDLAAAKRFAIQVCAACHVVSADQPEPPILRPPAPSFSQIANGPGITPDALHAFIATTHRTIKNQNGMPNPELDRSQIERAVAYLMSLRKRK